LPSLVSNNTYRAIWTYLARHGLTTEVDQIEGRPTDPALMKPSPHLPYQAAAHLGSPLSRSIFFGDSITDLQAA